MVKAQEVFNKHQIPFDQYQRYFTAASCIEAVRERNSVSSYRILELGANEHKNLKRFLPNDEIVFSDVSLTAEMKADPDFVQADGTNLPYEDGFFDFIIALDVLEHINQEKRAAFLKEANRVSKIGAIICCPYANEETTETESRINTYFHSISGKDYIWLKEHIDNGLPTTEEIEKTLQQCTTGFFSLYHGNLYLWEKLLVSHLNTVFKGTMQPYHSCIDEYYNKHLYGGDVVSPCYRVFFCCLKNEDDMCIAREKLIKQLAVNDNDNIYLKQLDALLNMQEQIVLPETILQLQKAVEDKERHIQNVTAELELGRQNILTIQNRTLEQEENYRKEHVKSKMLANEINQKNITLQAIINEQHELKSKLKHYQVHYQAAIAQREDLKTQLQQAQSMYSAIAMSTSWKVTKPIRVILDGIKKILKSNRYAHLFCKGLKNLKQYGVRATWKKVKRKLRNRQDFSAATRPLYTPEELKSQQFIKFDKSIKISIVVPLYNTPEKYLREMVQSVLDQTYTNWELCLANGSDNEHRYVDRICKEYGRKDQRIQYRKLEKNLGISENTNACIEMSTGDYIGLFDHDDLLHPAALFEVMKAICEKNADFIYTDETTFHHSPADAYCPHFKPDFAPDTLRSYNYICHFSVFRKGILEEAGGGLRTEYNGSQDYDLILRITEQARKIVHIPKILYYWRSHEQSVASNICAKPYTIISAKKALRAHLDRMKMQGDVLDSQCPSTYRIAYQIEEKKLVSIVIPNKDHVEDLKKCINSIIQYSTYTNWEIIIVENNSTQKETFAYYEDLIIDQRIRVVYWHNSFNYSAINNYGVSFANGDYVLLLNNDVEVITPDWIEQMMMFAQRKDVGAVGCMLYYPDETVQHAGVILGIGGVAGHAHKYFSKGDNGYMSRLAIAQNMSAVTAACIMIRNEVWNKIHGLDESFAVAFNDVDLCMRIRKAGYLIVWTPYAELYHYESKSRGLEDTTEKKRRFEDEVKRFQSRWGKELSAGDPYYNPNLTLHKEDFSLR